jgi:hypothetical protein
MRQTESNQPPVPPQKPLPSECCDSGCDPCIFDLYRDELAGHARALAEWRARHPDRTE